MRRRVGFIHTSPAAIQPLADYYRDNAPDIEMTNLLDDGILRFFSMQDERGAESRLADLLCAARDAYGSELAMVTSSAVSSSMVARLADTIGFPIVKIDEALAGHAVETGSRLGVLVTFPPTQAVTRKLLEDAALEAGRSVDLHFRLVPEAYEALLGGKYGLHDELLLSALSQMGGESLDAIVLAQLSMARLLPRMPALPMPVLSSLPASLTTIRDRLNSLSAPR
jgi:hypothetical protein